jgi:hypothetical protein
LCLCIFHFKWKHVFEAPITDFCKIRIPLDSQDRPSRMFSSTRTKITTAHIPPVGSIANPIISMNTFEPEWLQQIANQIDELDQETVYFVIVFDNSGKIELIVGVNMKIEEAPFYASLVDVDDWAIAIDIGLGKASNKKFKIVKAIFESSGRKRRAVVEDSDSQTEVSSSNDSSPRPESPVVVDKMKNVEFCDDFCEGENSGGD